MTAGARRVAAWRMAVGLGHGPRPRPPAPCQVRANVEHQAGCRAPGDQHGTMRRVRVRGFLSTRGTKRPRPANLLPYQIFPSAPTHKRWFICRGLGRAAGAIVGGFPEVVDGRNSMPGILTFLRFRFLQFSCCFDGASGMAGAWLIGEEFQGWSALPPYRPLAVSPLARACARVRTKA
jgi:hypothetical protein